LGAGRRVAQTENRIGVDTLIRVAECLLFARLLGCLAKRWLELGAAVLGVEGDPMAGRIGKAGPVNVGPADAHLQRRVAVADPNPVRRRPDTGCASQCGSPSGGASHV
jgi:hypothetical protein